MHGFVGCASACDNHWWSVVANAVQVLSLECPAEGQASRSFLSLLFGVGILGGDQGRSPPGLSLCSALERLLLGLVTAVLAVAGQQCGWCPRRRVSGASTDGAVRVGGAGRRQAPVAGCIGQLAGLMEGLSLEIMLRRWCHQLRRRPQLRMACLDLAA